MTIQIMPIMAALRHHKAGAILIALQVAITLAIVSNVIFIVRQRIEHVSLPTGIDEANIVRVTSQWVDKNMSTSQAASLMAEDLAAIRRIPGVKDAYASNAYPLGGFGRVMGVNGTPDQINATTRSATYFSDDHTISTLGLKLVSGRNFESTDVGVLGTKDKLSPSAVIVTEALARKMFPDTPALGKAIYISKKPSTIIGIVAELRAHRPETFASWWAECSMLVPYQMAAPTNYYMVRLEPGASGSVAKSVVADLYKVNGMRIIDKADGVEKFAEIRKKAYAKDRGMATLLTVICAILLFITAAGIVGLTSFWVGQRRRQIGIRRALGAKRADILSYFVVENAIINVFGAVVGIGLALAMNTWMYQKFEMDRLPVSYILVGVLVVMVLGLCAVVPSALNASRVSPVEAIRG